MRATQKKRISGAVTRTSLGKNALRSSESSSGQPRVEIGQSHEENQVSKTSSSWLTMRAPQRGASVPVAPATPTTCVRSIHVQLVGSSRYAIACPFSQVQTG